MVEEIENKVGKYKKLLVAMGVGMASIMIFFAVMMYMMVVHVASMAEGVQTMTSNISNISQKN